jgi:DNA-binding MarR family transcriptional regulator
MSPAQHRAWVAYMRVQLRMNYEINRQLQRDSGLSLADYHVMNALSNAPDHKMQVTELAALIGWERSRLSRHLRRLSERGLTKRIQSADDGRATDAVLTKKGMNAMADAAPGHAMLVKKLFFGPLPDELVAPFTAALEHIQASLNLNSSLPPYLCRPLQRTTAVPAGATRALRDVDRDQLMDVSSDSGGRCAQTGPQKPSNSALNWAKVGASCQD